MGHIAGAATVSHHSGLMQCEELRMLQGAGADSDLIPGYARVAKRIDAVNPDVVMIFDSHWCITAYHLVDGSDRYQGTYTSGEMPWYLHGVPYKYRGHPELAVAIEAVSHERKGYNRAIRHPDLGRHYATLNVIKQLRLDDGRVVDPATVTHLPPVTPSKIIAINISYVSRSMETRNKPRPTETPTYFTKPPTALNGHDGQILKPADCRYLNYEGEYAVVIGKTCRNVSPNEAWDYIEGFWPALDMGLKDFRDTDNGSMWRVKGADTLRATHRCARRRPPADRQSRSAARGAGF